MQSESFTANVCTTPCAKGILELSFNESTFYYELYYDWQVNGRFDEGEQVANYTTIPAAIKMDPKENVYPDGFYNEGTGTIINLTYGTGRDYFKDHSYQKKAGRVYGVKSLDGNYYYFSACPTTHPTKVHS